MFCESCGNKLPEGAKFCAGCGAKTESVQPAYAGAAPAAQRPAPPPAHTAPARAAYLPPRPPAYSGQPESGPLRVGQYIGMLLLMCVPILNIILLFVWSFGASANLNKKNFARASLILCAVMLVFWLVAGGLIMGALGGMADGYY